MKHPHYHQHLARHSDIREHLGLLRGLALECEVVVEFGFRTGVSTSAFLAAERPKVVSYDISPAGREQQELKRHYKDRFEFRLGDSRKVRIPETCLLFVDSDHTEETTYTELSRHHGRVRKWIVLHDVATFGRVDRHPGKGKGVLTAVEAFLEKCCHLWRIQLHIKNNNGLLLLERTGEV